MGFKEKEIKNAGRAKNDMKLVKPSKEYKNSFIEAIKEFESENESIYINDRLSNVGSSELQNSFESFLDRINNKETGSGLPPGRVPQTQMWLVDDGQFVGWVKIRHQLNEHLLSQGGHIGYAIRPRKRRMGYGNKILQLALPIAKSFGIEKALITCDDDNIGSAKIIENNGGILENKVTAEGGKVKRRYWVDLK